MEMMEPVLLHALLLPLVFATAAPPLLLLLSLSYSVDRRG
jgi:hypothetical protein